MTNDGLHTYTWNADGKSITMDTVTATYDALDRMVEENKAGTFTQLVYSPTGQRLAYLTGSSLTKAYVPLPGGGVAVYNSAGLNNYHHMDWLGSFRLGSSPTRSVIANIAYAPFGETYAVTGTAVPAFTGMTQDTDSNLYDFPAREYGTQGRWPSPDPAGLAAVNPAYPQSWNRYSYVLNNPLRFTDPTGLCDSTTICSTVVLCNGVNTYEPACFSSTTQPWLTTSNFACFFWGSCSATKTTGGGGGGGGFGQQWRDLKDLTHTIVCVATAPLVNVAQTNGGAVGIGAGAGGGAGLVVGLAAQVGVQVVADSQGNVGVAFSGGGNPGFGVFGIGAVGGVQFSRSSGDTIFDLRGRSFGAGGSGAVLGAGIGVDVAHSSSADTLTVTVGPGIGGKGAAYAITGTAVPKLLSTNCGPK